MASPQAPPLSETDLKANKGPHTLAIIITFPCLAAIVVGLRLYTRLRVVKISSHEDVVITLALVFSIATSICQGFEVHYGSGRHLMALTMEQGIGSLKALFASIIMYNFGLTLTKASIILQYLRISVQSRVRMCCWALFGFVIAYCIETFFSGLFSCYPVAKFWDDRIPGRCINKSALYYANAGINIFQDICLVVLPFFILKSLQLPRRQKISLVLILGLGGFASLASIFRLYGLHVITTSHDVSWDNPPTARWSAVELNVGIICASLPTLRALLMQHFPRAFGSSRRYIKNSNGESDSNNFNNSNNSDQLITTADHTMSGAADIEKGNGTFLASDSEQEGQRVIHLR